jgi:inhibitor of cysteine peptidase
MAIERTKAAARIGAALLAAAVPCGCAGAREASVPAASGESAVRLEARDSGRRVELRVGQRFSVALRANDSTGYSWKVVSSGEPVIRMAGEPAFVEDGHMAGAGGTLTYEFRAAQAGTAALELVYVRPWEKDGKPAGSFSLVVVVTK